MKLLPQLCFGGIKILKARLLKRMDVKTCIPFMLIRDTVWFTQRDNGFKFQLCHWTQFYGSLHKKLRDTTESEKAKSTDQDLAVASGSPYTRYTGNNQPTPCSPIYENYQHRKTELSTAHQLPFHGGQTDRSHCPPDELYVECDTNEAIYSNDPAFFQPHTENSEDLYILPDS
ncbi:hypothetical protein SRHO_G00243470 [Serrasalmus rhombeus]